MYKNQKLSDLDKNKTDSIPTTDKLIAFLPSQLTFFPNFCPYTKCTQCIPRIVSNAAHIEFKNFASQNLLVCLTQFISLFIKLGDVHLRQWGKKRKCKYCPRHFLELKTVFPIENKLLLRFLIHFVCMCVGVVHTTLKSF